ncbi:MAG: PfkB family carbohydrate kinase, partial [Cyclobacteriaceae bacterium]
SHLAIHYGGAEANVSVGISQLGIDSSFFTVLPSNDLSATAISKLKAMDVDTSSISFQDGRMGIYFLEPGKGIRPSKVVYDRAYSSLSLADSKSIDWDQIFEGIDWFHWSGITPAISASAAELCAQVLAVAEQKGITISVDLNYRSKLWNYGKTPKDIMPSLMEKCDVIFGGIDAPETYCDIVPEGKKTVKGAKLTDEDIVSIGEQVLTRFPKAKLFSSTMRETVTSTHNRLQGILYSKKGLVKSPEFDITEIVDRVGGGDGFMAGLIVGLIKYKEDYQYITNYATASSVWKHTVHGDYNYITEEELNQIIDGGTAVISR